MSKPFFESPLYRRLYPIARVLVALFFPLLIEGAENIPATGPVMLCSNHISLADPVLLGVAAKRQVHYMGKKELWKKRWIARLLAKLGAFPVDRGGSDLGAMRKSIEILKDGKVLGIYPQGHRYKRDDVRKVEMGAAMIALRSGAVVIPVHMTPPLRVFRRMRIQIGKPVDFSDLTARTGSAAMATATERIALGIWGEAALPGKD